MPFWFEALYLAYIIVLIHVAIVKLTFEHNLLKDSLVGTFTFSAFYLTQ